MALQKLIFRPGINREGTDYDNEGGWFDVNLVRFRKGRPEKFGGWLKLTANTFLGTARALHNWVTLSSTKLLGIGTNLKYYILEGSSYNDITPIRSTTAAGDVTFSATNSDATITVTDTAHGAVKNDFVTFSGASSLGGNITAAVLNQEYQIATIVNANSYTIEAKNTSGVTVTANSSDTGNGGGSVVGAYQINTGLDVFVASSGWGVNTWGDGGWGSTSPISASNQLRLWTHDNFGEDLVINPRGGGIFYWDQTNGLSTRAVALSSLSGANLTPTKALQVLTSETDRHLIVLGSDPLNADEDARTGSIDPMLITFSDQENPAVFKPLTTNTAGSLRLSSGSLIVGGVKARQEILVWTDTSLYSMQFIGPPFTFGINLINENSGLMAPKAAITTPKAVLWMGYENFYAYTGAVNKVRCTVQNYVFSDINRSQAYKIFAFTINNKNEVGWFYPSASSDEIDRYVIYNYEEDTWTYGQLIRTSWLDEGVENFPQASANNYIYQHETGFDDDGQPMTGVFIESSDIDIGEGDTFSFINRLIPDVKFLSNSGGGQLNMVTKVRNFPNEDLSTANTSEITSTTTQKHIRARGRQFVFRVESDDDNAPANTGTGWRLGATRVDVRQDGRR